MASDVLSVLTLLTNFLCMAISLWFAIYLLARSHANHITFRAVVALLALVFFYNSAFTELANPTVNTGAVRSLAVIIALIATHDLTHYLLPQPQRKNSYWIARGIVLLGVIAIILLFNAPVSDNCDPYFSCPSQLSFPWAIINLFIVLVFLAILYNLWQIRKLEGRLQNIIFFEAVLLGASTVGYGLIATALNLSLPRFLPNLFMLAALLLLAYSVTRERTFVSRRTTIYDLPITMLTIAVIAGIYILMAGQFGLRTTEILMLALLAIFTHSSYDLVRELLDRLLLRQERHTLRELRYLGRDSQFEAALPKTLRRGLAILCHNLHASGGFIAIKQQEDYEVLASLHSLPVGTSIPAREVTLEEITQPSGKLFGRTAWLAPAYVGSEQVAVIGIEARRDKMSFGEGDLYWLEDIADEIGRMVSAQKSPAVDEGGAFDVDGAKDFEPSLQPVKTEELLTTLAYKLDPELVKCIEDGFRNLYDYSKLGRSPLASMFGIQAEDHIERGKQVQQKLHQTLEKLRPPGAQPSEPIPREWYAYTILYSAYVEGKLARDIMSKLYISEGTYFRTRRRALRGITRALLEMGAVT
jgi:hypothetical protein